VLTHHYHYWYWDCHLVRTTYDNTPPSQSQPQPDLAFFTRYCYKIFVEFEAFIQESIRTIIRKYPPCLCVGNPFPPPSPPSILRNIVWCSHPRPTILYVLQYIATSQHSHRGQQTLRHEVPQAWRAKNESRQHLAFCFRFPGSIDFLIPEA